MIVYMISPVELISLKKTIAVQSIFPQNQDSIGGLVDEIIEHLIAKVAMNAYQKVIIKLIEEDMHCFGLAFFWILGHADPDMYSPQIYYQYITAITNDHKKNYGPKKAISDELAKKYFVQESLTEAELMTGDNMADKLKQSFLNHQQFLIMYWCHNNDGGFDIGHTYGVSKTVNNHNKSYYLIYDPSVTKPHIKNSVEEISEYFKSRYNTAKEHMDCFKLAFYSPLPPSSDQQVAQKRSIHAELEVDSRPDKSPRKKPCTDSNRNLNRRNALSPG